MKIFNIKNPENLFTKLDECQQPVDLVLNGDEYDWKGNKKLVRSLWAAMPKQGIDGLELHLHSGEDTAKVLDFLIRGNCA